MLPVTGWGTCPLLSQAEHRSKCQEAKALGVDMDACNEMCKSDGNSLNWLLTGSLLASLTQPGWMLCYCLWNMCAMPPQLLFGLKEDSVAFPLSLGPSKSPSACCLHINSWISFWPVQEWATHIWLQILPSTWKSWCSEQAEGHGIWGGACGYSRFQPWGTSCHEVKSREVRCLAASCLFKKQRFWVLTKSLPTQLSSN